MLLIAWKPKCTTAHGPTTRTAEWPNEPSNGALKKFQKQRYNREIRLREGMTLAYKFIQSKTLLWGKKNSKIKKESFYLRVRAPG